MKGSSRATPHVSIRIEPYLAEYARSLFGCGRADGAVRIPSSSGLYHLVYDGMARRGGESDPEDGNLSIVLPCRSQHEGDTDAPLKNPRYYNWLPLSSVRRIEEYLRRLFNFEFHQVMMDNEERGRPNTLVDTVQYFMRRHGLKSVGEDALLKNFQRFRRRVYPKKVRKYEKRR